MKKLLFLPFMCMLTLALSFTACSSDDDDDKPNPENVTNAIVLNGNTHKLTPIPAAELVDEEAESYGAKIYNTYTVEQGVSEGDYCAAYYMWFTTQNGEEIEWWFNSKKDPFNTTYVYSHECGEKVKGNYDSWFLLEGDNKNEGNIFSTGLNTKSHSITTSVKNNTLTIKGTFIDEVTGNTGTINVTLNNFIVK